jgi:opacity protein-like surface antigen
MKTRNIKQAGTLSVVALASIGSALSVNAGGWFIGGDAGAVLQNNVKVTSVSNGGGGGGGVGPGEGATLIDASRSTQSGNIGTGVLPPVPTGSLPPAGTTPSPASVRRAALGFGGITSGSKISLDRGAGASISAGYGWTDTFSTELQLGVSQNNVSSIGGVSTTDATLTQFPLMVGATVRIPMHKQWSSFLGVGVGTVLSKLDAGGSSNDTDVTFGYEAQAGISYAISDNWDLRAGYRFLGTTDHQWSFNGGTLKTDGTYSHSFLVSLNCKF